MLAANRLPDLSPVITHCFSYKDFPEAYSKSANYQDGVIKSMILWQDDVVSKRVL